MQEQDVALPAGGLQSTLSSLSLNTLNSRGCDCIAQHTCLEPGYRTRNGTRIVTTAFRLEEEGGRAQRAGLCP